MVLNWSGNVSSQSSVLFQGIDVRDETEIPPQHNTLPLLPCPTAEPTFGRGLHLPRREDENLGLTHKDRSWV